MMIDFAVDTIAGLKVLVSFYNSNNNNYYYKYYYIIIIIIIIIIIMIKYCCYHCQSPSIVLLCTCPHDSNLLITCHNQKLFHCIHITVLFFFCILQTLTCISYLIETKSLFADISTCNSYKVSNFMVLKLFPVSKVKQNGFSCFKGTVSGSRLNP